MYKIERTSFIKPYTAVVSGLKLNNSSKFWAILIILDVLKSKIISKS
jgi:hypothetical protein